MSVRGAAPRRGECIIDKPQTRQVPPKNVTLNSSGCSNTSSCSLRDYFLITKFRTTSDEINLSMIFKLELLYFLCYFIHPPPFTTFI